VSALPTSIGQTVAVSQETGDNSGLALFAVAFVAITMGIVYVQEVRRERVCGCLSGRVCGRRAASSESERAVCDVTG